MEIRLATIDDAARLWSWRIDAVVREHSFNSDPIPWEDHIRWYKAKLNSPDTRIYVLEQEHEPVAQIRYERLDSSIVEVGDISVAADMRGKGYGRAILRFTLEKAREEFAAQQIKAVVKAGNSASAKTFLSARFRLQETTPINGMPCQTFIYVKSGEAL